MRNRTLSFIIIFSLIGFIIVFTGSSLNNELLTSIYRGGIALIIAVILGFIFSHLWKWITIDLKTSQDPQEQVSKASPSKEKVGSGRNEVPVKKNMDEQEIKKTSEHVKDLMSE
ncbi:hypothetical protein CR194_07945 [Salipaludibacillus keqinensis]|uniref:Uncharacterized protein n=1 Tax=Salipaludibacillus keqinensis TaxID=2045207 RepID=A0A323TCQ5_9BACI|nr:hypothetical protein [Salipaludibacillus keqinensis]PYZ93122.1 hypothetical protein CR194_07945 [Salipaludibacillus keqinensis]